MIIYMGDTHGQSTAFRKLRANNLVTPDDIIIHVGDFGIDWRTSDVWESKNLPFHDYPCPVYFIDGNHEDFRFIREWSKTEITQVASKLFYVPRGYVGEFQDQRIGFLGGAFSIDNYWRQPEMDWFPHDEKVSDDNVKTLLFNVGDTPLDVLVTHSPPASVIRNNFAPLDLDMWKLRPNWVDTCSEKIQHVNETINPTLNVCGHMHRSVTEGNTRILNIDEVWSPQ